MPNDAARGPSRGAAGSAHLTRRPRRANYVPGGSRGFIPRGGYNPRGDYGSYNTGYAPRGNRRQFVGSRPSRGYVPRGGPGSRGGYVPRGSAHPNAAKVPHVLKHSVATWTVQVGQVVYSYVSRVRWRDQARPLRGVPPESIPEPFAGHTLEALHSDEPKAVYSKEEMEELCPSCGTLVVHWDTHVAGKLHEEKLQNPSGIPAVPTQMDVVAALRVLQATRPDIIAASLSAVPGASTSAAGRASKAGESSRDVDRRRSRDDYGHSRDGYGHSRDGYESPFDDYEPLDYGRSRDDYRGPLDNYEQSRYDRGSLRDDLDPLDDEFGRLRDNVDDEDLDGVPADDLDDLDLPM